MRFFSRLVGSGITLRPVQQLETRDEAGHVGFEATGNDPAFAIEAVLPWGRFRPSWYAFTVEIRVLDGYVVSPCLYADCGDGMSEATRIDLPEPDAQGRIRMLFAAPSQLRALRFDPSIHPARFRVGRCHMRPVSRPRALLEMAATCAGTGPHALRQLVRCVSGLAVDALRGRFRHGARALAARYAAHHRRVDRNYANWLELFEPRTPPATAPTASAPPFLSVLLPVCDPPPAVLRACLDSVLAQTDARWQLCIADDASRDPDVRAILSAYAAADARIRVTFGKARVHISENTNRALAMADGVFVGFLDHDDELAPDALEALIAAFDAMPRARMFYSDEDKIDADGHRHSPHFKPAWNPDLLRSLNYIAHFMVVETAVARELGGLRAGFEGSQDHDLALRCSERLAPDEIVHIPRILYHWRAIEGSTALGVDRKSYAVVAAQRAITEHLQRTGIDGRVEPLADGRFRVIRAVPPSLPKAVIVIPTRDRVELLRTCIDSIFRHTRYPNYEVIVVDNGSSEPEAVDYLDVLRLTPKVKVLADPAPFNFSRLVNRGVEASDGEVVCLLNNDIEAIRGGWLYELVSQAARADVGAVGAMLYYPDDTIQHAGVILGIGGVAGHGHCRLQRGSDGYISRARVVQNLTAVTGACMAFRRDVFDRVGGFDEGLAVAFNDVDFCLRIAAAGYVNVWTPFAELYHHESASRGAEDTPEKQARFQREAEFMKQRWGDVLESDPCYNPNLSLDNELFELAFPPRHVPCRTNRLLESTAA